MTASSFTVVGNLVDIRARRTYPAEVKIEAGRIAAITASTSQPTTYLLPGFIDAHVHVESSMLVPSEFARAAVVHGTVATVSDPHEIGNVLGVAGVEYMLDNAAQVPFKFYFGAPSCVPATTFETAGATITVAEVEALLDDPRIGYLSEMMNFPGVLHGDPECLAKIKAAHDRGKPVDGHAPGLRGEAAAQVHRRRHHDRPRVLHQGRGPRQAGRRLQDLDPRRLGRAQLRRAVHAASASIPAMRCSAATTSIPTSCCWATSTRWSAAPSRSGIDVFDALRRPASTPVEHYGLHVGQLRVGDPADFIEVDSLDRVQRPAHLDRRRNSSPRTAQTLIPRVEPTVVNNFVATQVRRRTSCRCPADRRASCR